LEAENKDSKKKDAKKLNSELKSKASKEES
jgi:hypothetical protein